MPGASLPCISIDVRSLTDFFRCKLRQCWVHPEKSLFSGVLAFSCFCYWAVEAELCARERQFFLLARLDFERAKRCECFLECVNNFPSIMLWKCFISGFPAGIAWAIGCKPPPCRKKITPSYFIGNVSWVELLKKITWFNDIFVFQLQANS